MNQTSMALLSWLQSAWTSLSGIWQNFLRQKTCEFYQSVKGNQGVATMEMVGSFFHGDKDGDFINTKYAPFQNIGVGVGAGNRSHSAIIQPSSFLKDFNFRKIWHFNIRHYQPCGKAWCTFIKDRFFMFFFRCFSQPKASLPRSGWLDVPDPLRCTRQKRKHQDLAPHRGPKVGRNPWKNTVLCWFEGIWHDLTKKMGMLMGIRIPHLVRWLSHSNFHW